MKTWLRTCGWGLGLVAGIFVIIAMSRQVNALSATGPDSAEFGGATVAYYLANTGAVPDATRLTIPVYYPGRPTANVRVAVSYVTTTSTIPNAAIAIQTTSGTPSTYNTPNFVNIDKSKFRPSSNPNYYVALVYATMEPVSERARSFTLTANRGAIIGYSSTNSERFAIANTERCDYRITDVGCGKYYKYQLPFAPECSLPSGQYPVVIYDGDNITNTGSGIYDGQYSMQYRKSYSLSILDVTTNRVLDLTADTTQWNNLAASGTSAVFQFNHTIGHKYKLILDGVYTNNVIQFKLPFDSINSTVVCPKPRATCDALSVADRALVGSTIQLKPSVRLSSSYEPPMGPGDPRMSLSISGPSTSKEYGSLAYSISGTGVRTVLTINPGQDFTPLYEGAYTVTWKLTGDTIASEIICTKVLDAGYRPYFSVTGGDIYSGGGIRSWNTDSGNYFGAGTTLAAIATGDIQNFVSGFGLPGGAATRNGSGLAFANSTASGTTYGGGYNVNAFTPTVNTTTPWTAATLNLGDAALQDGKTYTHSGNLTISGTLPTNKRVTVVLRSGSAIIAGNTAYGPYTEPETIPRFTLLVQNGNIYVDSVVTELRGVYYAAGSGGTFYSCATGAAPVSMTTGTAYVTCGKKLAVYGAVAATKLLLTRTYGSLIAVGATPAEPAEVFYYSPELWLSTGTRERTSGGVRYDSYVSLPPIL